MTDIITTLKLKIKGIVQGVGFRPFIYNLAVEKELVGWVRNSSNGVDIEVSGDKSILDSFINEIEQNAPPLSLIDQITTEWLEKISFDEFKIVFSEDDPDSFIPISPDISVCDDCLDELFDSNDKRYRYPFINCTNCGPRFTIIKSIPYDRPKTTMSPFELCSYCSVEYSDPTNRRFHAQPVACAECGPEISFVVNKNVIGHKEKALQIARDFIKQGKIVAIKGIGGFHLACDAFNEKAVSKLRIRKNRIDKAFAVMALSIENMKKFSDIGSVEEKELLKRERSILILNQKKNSKLAPSITPGQNTVGGMLPYTPIHYLLLEELDDFPTALVMTSGNISDEPIDIDNETAFEHLNKIADGFLVNDRDIIIRCDDSVYQSYENGNSLKIRSVRRSRGYAPKPISLPWELPPILAVGPELKNTFCLTRDKYAFVSHHIGNLENYETLFSFETAIEHYEKLFRIKPEIIAHDLHPDYLSTRYAQDRSASDNLDIVSVQHHHAHIASCMAENNIPSGSKVLGFSFDGTGFGDDGKIWGGEVLLTSYSDYERIGHVRSFSLPGGEKAIKEPWRIAVSLLLESGIDQSTIYRIMGSIPEKEIDFVVSQIESGINCPNTTSLGRLFDGISALLDIRRYTNYEGQAAIELDAYASKSNSIIKSIMNYEGNNYDFSNYIDFLIKALNANGNIQELSFYFHSSIAEWVSTIVKSNKETDTVALSGGVWQNRLLTKLALSLLSKRDINTIVQTKLPTNDGGVSFGQAVIAYHKLK